MGFEGVIRQLLLTNSTIATLVKDRIRPLYGAQADVRPLLTLQINSTQGTITHSGKAGSRNGSIEIGIIADKYADAVALSEAIYDTLSGYVGDVGGIHIAPCVFDDESDIEQSVQPGQSRPTYLKTVTYRARYVVIPS